MTSGQKLKERSEASDYSHETLRALYEQMVRIRAFEIEAGSLVEGGRVPGFLHLYVGQEAVAAGVMSVLTPEDQITSTHRGHGHAIAKGAKLPEMFAELLGKTTGYCHGKGGSMHINDLDVGMLGANAIVGGGIPIAVGAAFAAQYRGTDAVAVAFFGDGASNIGAFHESLNMAALMNLPVLFVCENNGYGEFTAQRNHMKLTDIAERGASYGMPAEIVDGMDALAVRRVAQTAVARARAGEGPTLIEAKTYRFYDHQGVKGLRIPYRPQEEVDEWKLKDPIVMAEQLMLRDGVSSQDDLDAVRARADQEVADAVAFADESPEPDPATDLLTDVYTEVSR